MDQLGSSLQDLFSDVVLARADLQRKRRVRLITRLDLGTARHRLADALRAYESALGATGAPMPYRLRDELRLLDALDRPDRGG